MGSYDGAETCELAGSFLLSQLQELNINIGLYRDDGLVKHHTERHRKLQKRNMPHLQSQRTTYHHRSQQTDHQFLRRHFQPKQEQLPALREGGIGIFGFAVLAIF